MISSIAFYVEIEYLCTLPLKTLLIIQEQHNAKCRFRRLAWNGRFSIDGSYGSRE